MRPSRLHPFLSRCAPFFRSYFLGLCLVATIHLMLSCSKDSDPGSPNVDPTPPNGVDVTKIHDGAKSAEQAFSACNPQQLLGTMTADAAAAFGDSVLQLDSTTMAAIGQAFATRHLDIYTEKYAEYSVTKDGKVYTVAFSRQPDNSWKLMRF